MAEGIPTPIDPITFGTSDADITSAVPTGKMWIVKEIMIANRDTSARGVAIKRRTAAAADFSVRVNGTSNKVAAEDTELWHLDLMLEAGEKLRGSADTPNRLDCNISVVEVTVV